MMRGYVPPDPETKVSEEKFAVVYAPRRNRTRFPLSCVEVVESEQQAISSASETDRRYAARVLGPSKSSEGQYIYYLMEWLEN